MSRHTAEFLTFLVSCLYNAAVLAGCTWLVVKGQSPWLFAIAAVVLVYTEDQVQKVCSWLTF